jgi:hypothetical protein
MGSFPLTSPTAEENVSKNSRRKVLRPERRERLPLWEKQ